MKIKKLISGFTLIEMMVAVVILGILAALAIPSYGNYVRRTQRAEARSVLSENMQHMERFLTINNRYDINISGVANALPLLVVPQNATGANIRYTVSFVPATLTATEYSIRAVPQGNMASDKCGTYTITHLGVRTISGAASDREECLN